VTKEVGTYVCTYSATPPNVCRVNRGRVFKKHFGAYALIYLFQHTNNTYQVDCTYTTALLWLPKNLRPWRDSNQGLLFLRLMWCRLRHATRASHGLDSSYSHTYLIKTLHTHVQIHESKSIFYLVWVSRENVVKRTKVEKIWEKTFHRFHQGCQIFLGTKYHNGEKCTKLRRTIPNVHIT
jgi:hypothetical protein